SFYQPLILGWRTKRLEFKVAYGFLAPTGRFDAGSSNNVGSGYWTHAPSSGLTLYLTDDRATAFSAFEMYEIHTTQEGRGIHPGDNFDLDYSITHTLRAGENLRVQLGLIGYGQWQTTAKTGPGVTPEQEAARYSVDALGIATNLMFPTRKVS